MRRLHFTRRSLVGLAIAAAVAILAPGCDAGSGTSAESKPKPAAEPAKKPATAKLERPAHILPILPARRTSPRRAMVDELHRGLSAGDYEKAARLNGELGQEALVRARRVLDAWKTLRDPATGFIPKSRAPQMQFWNPEDVGADCFPFLLYAAAELDSANLQLWLDTMAAERRVCGALPCAVRLPSGKMAHRNEERRLFGAVEYSKDGLLAVSERLGRGPWFDRMVEDMDAVIEAAPIETARGRLVSEGTEVNGELLIVLSRLWQATRNEKYIAMAERIADSYLFDVMPKNHGLPAKLWSFATMSARTPEFRLRDHGSEVVPGLAELYLVEKLAGRPAAARYREPVRRFLDDVLALPRTSDGMFFDSYDASTREPMDGDVADTWGYLLTGYFAFDLAEGTHAYSEQIERIMRAASTRHSFHWEGNYMDGYADTLESMLYMLPFHPLPESARWVDDEIEVMFGKQHDDGFVEGWYLDGNFVRTTMLYAHYKSAGLRAVPWSKDIRVGAVRDRDSGKVHVHVSATAPWKGRIVFDVPRHAGTWGFPVEYPRLNGLPEWFVVESAKNYVVLDVDSGKTTLRTGKELAAGVEMEVAPNTPQRLVVTSSN